MCRWLSYFAGRCRGSLDATFALLRSGWKLHSQWSPGWFHLPFPLRDGDGRRPSPFARPCKNEARPANQSQGSSAYYHEVCHGASGLGFEHHARTQLLHSAVGLCQPSGLAWPSLCHCSPVRALRPLLGLRRHLRCGERPHGALLGLGGRKKRSLRSRSPRGPKWESGARDEKGRPSTTAAIRRSRTSRRFVSGASDWIPCIPVPRSLQSQPSIHPESPWCWETTIAF